MEDPIKSLEVSSRRSAIVSLIGILIFIASLVYATVSLRSTNKELVAAEQRLASMRQAIDALNSRYSTLSVDVKGLEDDQRQLAEFLVRLIATSQENSNVASSDVQWEKITNCITDIPSGKRKVAVLVALLMTWKEIPFRLGENKPSTSFDSPGFLKYVIEQTGIKVDKQPNQPLSNSMMNQFKKVDHPMPGDLIFYKGQVGNFGLMYLCGDDQGNGIAIGTLQAVAPLGIYKTDDINTAFFPLRGYFRVDYEAPE